MFEVVVALLLGGAALAAAFTQAIEALGSAFAGVLARYTQVWCIQLAQHAVCNRVHRVVERCARWLLQTQDRVGRAAFPLTQEFLAMMLGAPGFSSARMPGREPRAHRRLRNPASARDGTLLPPLCLQRKRPLSARCCPVLRKRLRVQACSVARRQNLERFSLDCKYSSA